MRCRRCRQASPLQDLASHPTGTAPTAKGYSAQQHTQLQCLKLATRSCFSSNKDGTYSAGDTAFSSMHNAEVGSLLQVRVQPGLCCYGRCNAWHIICSLDKCPGKNVQVATAAPGCFSCITLLRELTVTSWRRAGLTPCISRTEVHLGHLNKANGEDGMMQIPLLHVLTKACSTV